MTRAAFRAFDLCAVADEELAAVRLAVVVERELCRFAARVVPAARGEVEKEVLCLVGSIEHILPAAVEDIDAVAGDSGIKAAEMVSVVAALVVGVDAVAVMQGDEVIDTRLGRRERCVVNVVPLAVQGEADLPGMMRRRVGHQSQVVEIVMQGGLTRSRFDETDVGVAADICHRRTDVGFLRLAECPKAA